MTDHPKAIPRHPLAWPAGWVRKTHYQRKPGQFTQSRGPLTVFAAVQRLQAELDRLGAKNAVLSFGVRARLDGYPRSGEPEPADPGVAVYFGFNGKATVFACDSYTKVAQNIAAIAAHVDALRRIQRYGVGSIEQAIAGYKALPADTAADWRTVLELGARPLAEDVERAYKHLARRRHPDAGGSEEGWYQLQRAYEFAKQELGL